MTTVLTLRTMMQNTFSIRQEIEEHFDLNKANQITQTLFQQGSVWIQQLVAGQDQKENPLPIALELIDLLSKDQLQCCDALKYTLSKTSRLFLEVVLFRSHFEARRFYPQTKDDLLQKIDRVLQTLPQTQVSTTLELKSAREATKALKIPMRSHLLTGAKALVTMEVSELVSLCMTIANTEIVKGWYRFGWGIRWSAPQMRTLEDLNAYQKELSQYRKKGNNFSLYLTEVFMEILQSPQATPNLKKAVFCETTPNLLLLAKHSKKTLSRDKYWPTRYRTLEHLNTLVESPDSIPPPLRTDFIQKSLACIAIQITHPKEKGTIKRLGIRLYREATDQTQWKKAFSTIDKKALQGKGKKDPEILELKKAISQKTEQIDQRKKRIQQKREEEMTLQTEIETGEEAGEYIEEELEQIKAEQKQLLTKNRLDEKEIAKLSFEAEEIEDSYEASEELLSLIDTL